MTESHMDVVALVNTQARILHLPDTVKRIEGRDGAFAVVANTDGRTLVPSVPRKDGAPTPTKIDAKYWEYAKSKPAVKVWLKLGWLKVLDAEAPGVTEDESLAKYNAQTALTLVGVEENHRLLLEWQKTETRSHISAAIEARIEHITRPTKLAPLGKSK